MSEGSESPKPQIYETGFNCPLTTGTDASKPVKERMVKIVQVGESPSNIEGRDIKTGEPVKLPDVQKVTILKALQRTVPDDLARRVDQYYGIQAKKFANKYMPKRK